uniref:Uncharacterized protein n=1 Tax=Tetranychus urticae TaxID=32264 RepID=T1L520_TETUR
MSTPHKGMSPRKGTPKNKRSVSNTPTPPNDKNSNKPTDGGRVTRQRKRPCTGKESEDPLATPSSQPNNPTTLIEALGEISNMEDTIRNVLNGKDPDNESNGVPDDWEDHPFSKKRTDI